MSAANERDLYAVVLQAGERLITAFAEEHALMDFLARHADDPSRYLELLTSVRRTVDDCAAEYCRAIDLAGYPDLPIRHAIECESARVLRSEPCLAQSAAGLLHEQDGSRTS